jgi:hypothetical protein
VWPEAAGIFAVASFPFLDTPEVAGIFAAYFFSESQPHRTNEADKTQTEKRTCSEVAIWFFIIFDIRIDGFNVF